MQGHGERLVQSAADGHRSLAVAGEGGIERAIAVVTRDGEVVVGTVAAPADDDVLAVGLDDDFLGGVGAGSEGRRDTAAATRGEGRRGVGGQQAIPGYRRQSDGVDAAGGCFELPVAAECAGASGVGAGRDIGSRQPGQFVDEGLPGGTFGDIAAVKQQVAVGGQRLPPALQQLAVFLQRLPVEVAIAEDDFTAGAVADQVHGGQIVELRKYFADLLQAVIVGVEDSDLQLPVVIGGRQVGEQCRPVGDAAVDDHHFVPFFGLRLSALRRRGVGRRGRFQPANLTAAVGGQRVQRRQIGGIEQPRFEFFDDRTLAEGLAGVHACCSRSAVRARER
ncbi:MAG: hypothetical protein RKR04_17020 [Candidatus Accumulibacter sp.]|nr:hypothetical protein [Accumulibacter sp.]MDS4056737.1 hypothetical protein [Accumulibacter sp.]